MARPPKAREPLKVAALELFVEQGVHGTGIRDIAKHAGCSEAALYRHWANKEALVAALYIEHLTEVRSRIETALASQDELGAKMQAGCAACYLLYDEQPLVFRFVLLVQHELAKSLPTDLRMPQDVITEIFTQQIALGRITGEPALLAAAVIGLFLETAIFVLYGRLPGPMSRYVEPVTGMVMRVLEAK